ncbi:FixG Ig-like domain-containing protein, partial [Methylocella sp.]|uniref:FixG Ig-like domain-containing protein n=1 Tax=Methylocella sp. TaxID=1978226 RepID=UPI003C1AFA80
VDIREGPSLGCIQCGLCIDACDAVMKKVERPSRLIAYDTDVNVGRRLAGEVNQFRPVRSRTILYAAVIAIVGGVMLAALIGRHDMTVSVMHDRNPMFVKTADGSIRNALTVHIVNRQSATRQFAIRLDRPQGGRLAVVGDQQTLDGSPTVEVGPDQVLELRMLVTIPPGANPSPSQQLVFKVTDLSNGETATAADNFFAP